MCWVLFLVIKSEGALDATVPCGSCVALEELRKAIDRGVRTALGGSRVLAGDRDERVGEHTMRPQAQSTYEELNVCRVGGVGIAIRRIDMSLVDSNRCPVELAVNGQQNGVRHGEEHIFRLEREILIGKSIAALASAETFSELEAG